MGAACVRPAACCGGSAAADGTPPKGEPGVTFEGKISTVVLLVMENRSFDNMLGFLLRDSPNEYKDIDPERVGDFLQGDEFNIITDPTNTTVEKKVPISDNAPYITEADPPHGFGSIRRQIYGSDSSAGTPVMSGFGKEAETEKAGFSTQVMSCFNMKKIPITAALAREFALCTRWYAGLPTSTQPNRFCIHSTTSHGAVSNVTLDLIKGFPQKTIFESVEESGKSFKIYYQNIPATLFLSRLRNVKYLDNFTPYDNFQKDAKAGKLPNYAVIEQKYFESALIKANDNHPPHDVRLGEALIKEIYETLRASPKWNETLFIITYDEHGGLYDHKAPPSVGIPNPDGLVGPEPDKFNFDRLGVRVPTILISPWIKRNTLVGEPSGPTPTSHYEHSSIAATLKKMFNLKSFLTKRDEWAGTFEGVLSLSQPRTDCPLTLPEVPPPDATDRELPVAHKCQLHEWQKELVLLAYVLTGATGPDVPQTCEDVAKLMDSEKACEFVEKAVETFMQQKAKGQNTLDN
ncbi:hypothetical protein R1sor_015068 [Riccia sorocarpa]|uniref:Phosphoesterase n=1 Tax=Riccia sorocarpa TaxID=122646 RepID=A0ABD3HHD7_9MARC